MSNMSYCRFENTLADLVDCQEALPDFRELSESETDNALRLISVCIEIAHDYGHLHAA